MRRLNDIKKICNMYVATATSELSGQNLENSGFKGKGRLDNASSFC